MFPGVEGSGVIHPLVHKYSEYSATGRAAFLFSQRMIDVYSHFGRVEPYPQ